MARHMEAENVAETLDVMRPIDAAVRLGISITTVYTMIRSGELASQMVVLPGRSTPKRMVLGSAVREREAKK